MSELKVNEISGLGGTVKINGQVGLPSIVGTNKLTVDGTIRAEGSIEVVTVSAESYGVKVKGPQSPSTGDSIIKFTSYTETERAAISAKDDKSLVIGTNGIERFTIDSTGLITHKFKSAFTGTSQFDGVATFSPVPVCAAQCTALTQLANKAYVDGKIATGIAAIPKSGFGDYVAIGDGTFQAATDGFVMANWDYSQWPHVYVYADKISPPTTLRQHHSSDDDGGGQQSLICPIPKGYYYKIVRTGSSHINMFWLPVGG